MPPLRETVKISEMKGRQPVFYNKRVGVLDAVLLVLWVGFISALLYGHGFEKMAAVLRGGKIQFMHMGITAAFAEGLYAILLVTMWSSRLAPNRLPVVLLEVFGLFALSIRTVADFRFFHHFCLPSPVGENPPSTLGSSPCQNQNNNFIPHYARTHYTSP